MDNKLVVAVALAAGLVGGMLTRYLAPPPVFAQTQTPVTNEIRARSFVLVDQFNEAVGTFTSEPLPGRALRQFQTPGDQGFQLTTPQARIVLRDANGRELWSAGGNPIRPLNATVR